MDAVNDESVPPPVPVTEGTLSPASSPQGPGVCRPIDAIQTAAGDLDGDPQRRVISLEAELNEEQRSVGSTAPLC